MSVRRSDERPREDAVASPCAASPVVIAVAEQVVSDSDFDPEVPFSTPIPRVARPTEFTWEDARLLGIPRPIGPAYVVEPTAQVHDRCRLELSLTDLEVTLAVGDFLTHLLNADLAERCRLGTAHEPRDWGVRKQRLTAQTSSRWAGSITRAVNELWAASRRNHERYLETLEQMIETLAERLAVPVGEKRKKSPRSRQEVFGYPTEEVRARKAQRLAALQRRLAESQASYDSGRESICRGGRKLVAKRQHLAEAGLTAEEWRIQWRAARFWMRAEGESAKFCGNETLRVYPDGRIELRLPEALKHLSNATDKVHYVYDFRATFPVRQAEWLLQVTAKRAVCYEVMHDPKRDCWYLDMTFAPTPDRCPQKQDLAEALSGGVLGIDLNDELLAGWRLDPSGNPVARPVRAPVHLKGLSSSVRDGHLRDALSVLLRYAVEHGIRAIAVEDLDFEGRKTSSREKGKGRQYRSTLHGLPVAQFRSRLVAMATRLGIAVVAVPSEYSSKWGAAYWQQSLSTSEHPVSRHDAASVVIARRAQGHSALRRGARFPPKRQSTEKAGASSRRGQDPARQSDVHGPAGGTPPRQKPGRSGPGATVMPAAAVRLPADCVTVPLASAQKDTT